MADSYGFRGEEEWGRVQQYLKSHGGWQLEQVGITGESAQSLPLYMVACHVISLVACSLVRCFMFQVGGMGNCLYASVKKGLGVRVANNRSHPYYPTCYMHRQVADWLVSNRQRVMMHKGPYLRETYSLADPTATFPQPFSYKQYCRQVLDKRFWGDAVILYAISCLWALKITSE